MSNRTRLSLLGVVAFVAATGAARAGQPQRPSDLGLDGPPPPVPPATVSRDAEGRVTLRAVRLLEPLVIDGLLNEPVYQTTLPVSDFVQQEPHEGEPATEKTEAWIFFDDKNIYVSARCSDSHPERMIANDMRRDGLNLFNNENLAVALDTYYDRRNGFLFHTNPIGGMFDGYITDERLVNRDWNTVWESKSRVVDGGWSVEMSIPFKSLRYRPGTAQIWGINLRRVVRWKNELSYLTRVPAALKARGLAKLSSAATLVGLETPARSMNLELKPYAISSVTTDREAQPVLSNDLSANAGIDMKYGVTRSLTTDFTYNTDFAQAEDDEQQVNLTRFSLFFPEKREFFLEGQGIFYFGTQKNPDPHHPEPPSNTPIMFFSRRIGLNEDRVIPIQVGGRLTGTAGPYTIGALDIQTEADTVSGTAATNFSVLRLKRNILRRSYVGVIATRRGPSLDAGGSNLEFGADANFSLLEELTIISSYARTETPGLEGDSASAQGQLEYNGDRYGLQLDYLAVGEHFNPELGFMRRTDFRRGFAQGRFSPRPKGWRGVRKIGWEANIEYITDGTGESVETRQLLGTFRMELENGDQWKLDVTQNFEGLDEPFEIADGVVIPVGGYDFNNLLAQYELGPQRRVSGAVTAGWGGFYGGTRTEAGYKGRIELSPRLSVEPNISINWIDIPQARFTTSLIGGRVTLSFTPRAFVGALIQYNSSGETLGANVRFRWEYSPGSDLFVVYNEGRNTMARGTPALQNRSFVVKISRLFRF